MAIWTGDRPQYTILRFLFLFFFVLYCGGFFVLFFFVLVIIIPLFLPVVQFFLLCSMEASVGNVSVSFSIIFWNKQEAAKAGLSATWSWRCCEPQCQCKKLPCRVVCLCVCVDVCVHILHALRVSASSW